MLENWGLQLGVHYREVSVLQRFRIKRFYCIPMVLHVCTLSLMDIVYHHEY